MNNDSHKASITLSANTSWYLYNFRRSTIIALQEMGYKVICISPEDGYSQKLVSERSCQWLPLKMDNQGSNPLKDLYVFWQLFTIYRRCKPKAALHFTIKNNVYGTWAAKLLGIPALNNVSGLGTAFIHRGLVPQMVRFLYKLSFPLAFRVFCQNDEDAQLLIQEKLVPEKKLTRLPGSGVDINRFSPLADKQRGDPFIFIFAGRMLADKGLYELIEAMHALNNKNKTCELLLCGFLDVKNATAISTEQMQKWTQAPYIHYLGSSDSMELELAKADCVVLPSYREGMPRSLLEAGAMALPSIASDVAGCRNIIEHQVNGLLCEAKSAQSLQFQMESLMIMSDDKLASLGNAAREKIVQSFSEEIVVDMTLEAIDEALK